jgi:hypothetical protein
MSLNPPDFDQWFASSAGTGPDGRDFTVQLDKAWLSLPTGRVVATEPITVGMDDDDDPHAFTQTVPPGRYPVVLLIADGLVAAARLVIRDERATAWEPAVPEGHDPHDHGDGALGYPVEGGIGCFTDEQTLQGLCADGDLEWMQDLMLDVADRSAAPTVMANSDEDGEPVLVAFRTGEGDGQYPTWAGRNANGDITCFVTDFLLHEAQPAR